jgi:hypothetical protein
MRAFLSHISEEALEARALKESLEDALSGFDVFVSAADIQLGDAWLKEIENALQGSQILLSLCSPSSVRRAWLNFESGTGWIKGLKVVPICYKGLRKEQLPDPLHIFQAIELIDSASCHKLVDRLASELSIQISDRFNPAKMFGALRVDRPARTNTVGMVLCHGQREWDSSPRTVFAFPASLPPALQERCNVCAIDDERTFLSPDLHKLSGLVVGSPWRAKIPPETISAVVEWVRAGGRLLLLGFELGDRHHAGNLSELSRFFGIVPGGDIVGPPNHKCEKEKPYNLGSNRYVIEFFPSKADPHSFTEHLTTIRLTNVQTVQVEPGGTEWLRVGKNVVCRPRRDRVIYRDGIMTAPAEAAFETNRKAEWLPVAVEAPQGLCGAGVVHMIGSWDLMGRHQLLGDDNVTLLTRMFEWLSGRLW